MLDLGPMSPGSDEEEELNAKNEAMTEELKAKKAELKAKKEELGAKKEALKRIMNPAEKAKLKEEARKATARAEARAKNGGREPKGGEKPEDPSIEMAARFVRTTIWPIADIKDKYLLYVDDRKCPPDTA